MPLQERVAIATGAASGIGKAIAERFAREGAFVVIADKNEAAMRAAIEELQAAGAQATGFTLDVTDRGQIQEFVRKVIEAQDRIDILVNNAGITRYRPFLTATDEDWDLVLDVDLKRGLLLRAGSRAAHDPAALRQDRQYLLRSRDRDDTTQYRGIAGRKLGLRCSQSRGDPAYEDIGAGAWAARDKCELCRAGYFSDAAHRRDAHA